MFGSSSTFLGLSFLIAVLLRAPYFQHDFIFVDEAWWANGAKVLLEGGQLYRDIWIDKQPGIFLFCAMMFKIVGLDMLAVHIGSLCLALLTTYLVYRIGAIFSPSIAGAAAVVFALASTNYYLPRIVGMNTETLMVVFSSASMLCFLSGLRSGKPICFVLAGLLSSFAAIAKPPAAVEMLVFVAFVFFKTKRAALPKIRVLTLMCGGYASGFLLLLAYLIRSGTVELWWEQTIRYEIQYVRQFTGLTLAGKLVRAPASFFLIYSWLGILIWRGRPVGIGSRKEYWLLWGWLLSALVAVVGGRRLYANYFIQAFPSMALLGAMGAVALWENRSDPKSRRVAATTVFLFLVPFLWFHSRTLAHWYFLLDSRAHQSVQLWGMCRESRTSADVARHIEARTEPDERIFVWGPKPELYFLSRRAMATKFMEYDVGADVPLGASSESTINEMVETLNATRPRYIVDVMGKARIENFIRLNDVLDEQYLLEKEMHQSRIYRRAR